MCHISNHFAISELMIEMIYVDFPSSFKLFMCPSTIPTPPFCVQALSQHIGLLLVTRDFYLATIRINPAALGRSWREAVILVVQREIMAEIGLGSQQRCRRPMGATKSAVLRHICLLCSTTARLRDFTPAQTKTTTTPP
jgi:hypothetical protein